MNGRRAGWLTIAVVIVSLLGAVPAGAEVVPVAGFTPRTFPATAVVGEKLFVFGGQTARNKPKLLKDGAIVNTRTGGYERIADAPFRSLPGYPEAEDVGKKVLVVGAPCREDIAKGYCDPGITEAAVYDVKSDSWRSANLPESLRQSYIKPLGTTSDDRIVLETRDSYVDPRVGWLNAYWTYSPDLREWKRLPDPGFLPMSACVKNDEVVLLRMKLEQQGVVTDENPTPGGMGSGSFYVQPSIAVLSLKEDGEWRTTPPDPTARYEVSPPTVTCLDRAAMIVDSIRWFANLRVYDEEVAAWSVPSAPPPTEFFSAHRVWTGDELIILPSETSIGEPGPVYNPTTDSWRELEHLPPMTRSARWTGSAVIGYSEPLQIFKGPGKPPGDAAGVYRVVP